MTMAAEARKPPSMALQVADRIRNAIILAEFDLGEALSEDSLAAAMGISRTPVREALRLLQTEGLVTVVPKSGTFVFNP
ncbi:MAG TPA: winged helix-turn-helix domain-containing protein, partial [Skermanella sp.]|nr:winged helix-turn-helix domain-containing protein [Skermanella sp.]